MTGEDWLFSKERLVLKHLMTRRFALRCRAGRDQGGNRRACPPSTLHSYRPLIETLEDRTLLSFIAAPTYAAGGYAESVAVGDFNGDAIPDLAVANGVYPAHVSVLLGKGDGIFQAAQSYATGASGYFRPNSVAVGDFNGDGH